MAYIPTRNGLRRCLFYRGGRSPTKKNKQAAVQGAEGSAKLALLPASVRQYPAKASGPSLTIREGTEKVDNTACVCYNVYIKYRRCFYDRTTAEIGVKSIHGNI